LGSSEIPRKENQIIFCHIIQSSRKTAPQQELGLHLVEVPSLLIALNNTNNESYPWRDSSILLTGIQSPPRRWKTFVGNRVAIIQEEIASAPRRHVPSQSNPADLISRGVEPATLSTSTLWWKEPQWLTQEPSSWPATEVNTHRKSGNQKCACCTSTTSRRHHTKILQVDQTQQSY